MCLKRLNWDIVAVFILVAVSYIKTCPLQCICNWKSGKQSAACVGKDLGSIPKNLDSETQIFDLSKNNLQILHKEVFQKYGLINLQKIYLSKCRLQNIDDLAFKGLQNLVELDLSENNLMVIPSANFEHVPTLMKLILSENPITKIQSQAFRHLTLLNRLEISFCKLDDIEADSFVGLAHLEWLRLDNNKIKTIRGDAILPDTLKRVELQNNDWICDCEMQDLHAWLLNFNIPHNLEPFCVKPEQLSGKTIKSLKQEEFACLPIVLLQPLLIEITEGKTISIKCKVYSKPEAKITWWFQKQRLTNESFRSPGLHFLYFVEHGTFDKTSELTILDTDLHDNGTYTCKAENKAGISVKNMIVQVLIQTQPLEEGGYFLNVYIYIFIIALCLIIIFVALLILILFIKRCKKKTKPLKKNIALQNHFIFQNAGTDLSSNNLISNFDGSFVICRQNSVMRYPLDVLNEQSFSPNSLQTYVGKNSDLIHDPESKDMQNEFKSERHLREIESIDEMFDQCQPILLQPQYERWKGQHKLLNNKLKNLPRITSREFYQQQTDVILNSVYVLHVEGYPVDYGLPKVPCKVNSVIHQPNSLPIYYQTFQHHENKSSHFVKDAEYNSPSTVCTDVFPGFDVRYTVGGYPSANNCSNKTGLTQAESNFIPSPPRGYKSYIAKKCNLANNTNLVPLMTQITAPIMSQVQTNSGCSQVQSRWVSKKTTNKDVWNINVNQKLSQVAAVEKKQANSAKSVDRGYVGDGIEASDI